MLNTHYRNPIDWTVEKLRFAQIRTVDWLLIASYARQKFNLDSQAVGEVDSVVLSALEDDLNTYGALDRMYHLGEAALESELAAVTFLATHEFLGFDRFVEHPLPMFDQEQVVRLIEDRLLARYHKDWKESDRIRDELDTMGIAIKDNKDGTTTWEVKR